MILWLLLLSRLLFLARGIDARLTELSIPRERSASL